MTWLSMLGWLVGSKAGRVAAVALMTLALLGLAMLTAFRRGGAMERAAFLLLSGATVSCGGPPRPDDWCLTNRPLRPTRIEVATMSDATVSALLSHNTYGARRCGWKP